MEYYFYNTDLGAMGGESRFHLLIDGGFAATSGDRVYGEHLGKLVPDDTLLMYENGLGIVAIGTVRECWDGQSREPQLYYRPGFVGSDGNRNYHEYRIRVDWSRLDKPITLGELRDRLGSPRFEQRGAIQRVVKRRAEVEAIIAQVRAPVPATPEAADLPQPPDRVKTETYRILRDTAIARKVKVLHRYKCQICGHTIKLPDGSCYAEAHHIRPLGKPDSGPDVVGNILCLCPNHHAELDLRARPITMSALRLSESHAVDPQYVDYHNEHVYTSRG